MLILLRKKQKGIIRILSLLLVLLLLLGFVLPLLTGCSKKPEILLDRPTEPVVEQLRAGQTFVSSSYKIRTVVTPQTVATLDPVVFEVYVDGNGNGSGLMGYKDDVYNLVITGDRLYVQVKDSIIVAVTDITGHMIPASLNLESLSDLSSIGFTLYNNDVAAYRYADNTMVLEGTYQPSTATFSTTSVIQGNNMGLIDLINYILNYIGAASTTPEQESSVTVVPEKESFYTNSVVGVRIHDKVYSIGDYCNPTTYFEDITPSGIVPSYGWNGDNKVTFQHITYSSSDGETEFMTSDGYVQAIVTTCPFEFVGLKSGTSTESLQRKLGISLKKDEIATWTPIIEGLSAEKDGSNNFLLTYNDLTIKLVCGSKSKQLGGISITKYIDFLKG